MGVALVTNILHGEIRIGLCLNLIPVMFVASGEEVMFMRESMAELNYTTVDGRAYPIIYFVLPCYNEADGLRHTAEVLLAKYNHLVQSKSINERSRIIFVDDGSKDETWDIIVELHKLNHPIIGGVKLTHNRGHQNALLAGLMFAFEQHCDAAISMDADLQDDVNVVDEFIANYKKGDEIVYGVRSARDADTWFKRTTAESFYKIFEWMGAETIPNHADYRLMSREALDALSEYHEVNLFLRGIVPTLGYQTSKVYYKRGEREAGESKYPLKKMISFAIQGITSFSTKPLSFVTGVGLVSIVVAAIMFVYILISFGSGHSIAGWGSLMCSLWFIGGLLMMSLGIVGEYIGKIYMETKARPRYRIEITL